VVFSARAAFSRRSWPYVLSLALPWLLLAGQRCITRMASLAGHRRSLSAYYRFLSHGKWRLEALFRSLFLLILRWFPAPRLTLVLDDTLSPKWGKGIFGAAAHFDRTRRPRAGFVWGHDWVVLAVVVQLGKAGWAALPFWVSLYRPQRICPAGEFRTRIELALQALRAVRRWFPGPVVLLADGAYNNRSLIDALGTLKITLVSRLRTNACLREPSIPVRKKRRPGRPAKHGPWLPALALLARRASDFVPVTVSLYGRRVPLLLREVVAYWPPIDAVIKVVITRDPQNPRRVAFLSSTDPTLDAAAVVEAFGQRWSIEQFFSVAKNQLGLGSAEVRTPASVVRHAALAVALATWVEVWARRAHPRSVGRSFASKLALLRQESVASMVFASGPRTRRSREIARGLGCLFSTATRVA
jgi:hypothetical protein